MREDRPDRPKSRDLRIAKTALSTRGPPGCCPEAAFLLASCSMGTHTFQVFPADRLTIVQWAGHVTFGDVVMWLADLARHPEFSSDFDGIADVRKADVSGMTPAEVKKIAELMAARKVTRGSWAYLVTGPTDTAFAMMYSRAVNGRYRVGVFSTVEAAAEYLGRSSAVLLERGLMNPTGA